MPETRSPSVRRPGLRHSQVTMRNVRPSSDPPLPAAPAAADAPLTAPRRPTRAVRVGTVQVGAGAPVSVQSMTCTPTREAAATLTQIAELAELGCEIIRVAVPDRAAVAPFGRIVAGSPLPVVADVHFDYRLALAALDAGAACVRVNPGNIARREHLRAIARRAAACGTPVRIGVNGGSLEKDLLERHGAPTPAALVESALRHCRFFEDEGCAALKVSLKSSRVADTVAACRLFAGQSDLPLHLGVTEAGTLRSGIVKSAVALGALLLDGIGDTLRVSLTAPPREEILAGIGILEAAGLRPARPEIVSCPTCGRTQIDLVGLVAAVEAEIARLKAAGRQFPAVRIAIMGCVVNGPGEAREADLGLAGGKGKAAIFRHGEIVRTVPESEMLREFLAELHGLLP